MAVQNSFTKVGTVRAVPFGSWKAVLRPRVGWPNSWKDSSSAAKGGLATRGCRGSNCSGNSNVSVVEVGEISGDIRRLRTTSRARLRKGKSFTKYSKTG